MALLMAARQPDLWAAVSAWAGITDMAAYYRERLQDKPPMTTNQLAVCMGGAPGANAAVDAQYVSRSPVTNLARAAKVPIDIWNGRDDGDVSLTHAVLAFNRLADATSSRRVSADEIAQSCARVGTSIIRSLGISCPTRMWAATFSSAEQQAPRGSRSIRAGTKRWRRPRLSGSRST